MSQFLMTKSVKLLIMFKIGLISGNTLLKSDPFFRKLKNCPNTNRNSLYCNYSSSYKLINYLSFKTKLEVMRIEECSRKPLLNNRLVKMELPTIT